MKKLIPKGWRALRRREIIRPTDRFKFHGSRRGCSTPTEYPGNRADWNRDGYYIRRMVKK